MDWVAHDQNEEFAVIALANAIVQPDAVMVEAFDTLIALATVFGGGVYPLIANYAPKNSLAMFFALTGVMWRVSQFQ